MHFEILVEELSAEKALIKILPKFLPPDVEYRIYPHNGKGDLMKQLGGKLRGYSKWLPENWYIIILRDSDEEDCKKIKDEIENICQNSGISSALIRIAVKELEAWFFGDPKAIEIAYPRCRADRWKNKAKYRNPDNIRNTWETLDRLLKSSTYSKGYLKTLGASNIASHMDPERNKSHSFQVFKSGLLALVGN
jgi:hypothetical protein